MQDLIQLLENPDAVIQETAYWLLQSFTSKGNHLLKASIFLSSIILTLPAPSVEFKTSSFLDNGGIFPFLHVLNQPDIDNSIRQYALVALNNLSNYGRSNISLVLSLCWFPY